MAGLKAYEGLTFSLYEHAEKMKMYESYYRNGAWDEGSVVPFHAIPLSPAANILNYGQGIFEGMKAYLSAEGNIVMFRPEENARRFLHSCHQLCMAPVPVEKFMGAIREVVVANEAFIPNIQDGRYSMYLRPVNIGIESQLGVRASSQYLFYIFASPVGPYFTGVGVVRLWVTATHRAAANGTGNAKAACNYAVTMPPKIEAKKHGYDEALYLDSVQSQYIEEAGAANFFALMEDDTLVTPQLGSILPGITRDSIITLARDMFGMRVVERNLGIEEVCRHAKECFLCGTGATVTSISEIHWQDTGHNVNRNDFQLAHRIYDTLIGIQTQRHEDPYNWMTVIKKKVKG